MPLWKNTQHSFAAGQLDTHVMGRQDMDKYAHGATLLKNFLVKRQGCISKRRGTDLTANLDGLLGTTYGGDPIVPEKMRLVPVTNGDDGRYVILSGGIGFVASRDGVLTSDRNHVRAIHPYIALDEDGKAVVITGKDVRQSTDTPVDLIHRISAGNYTVTRCATLQAAFDAAVDGDTVRLHSNLHLSAPVTVTPLSSWHTDGGTSAAVTYNADTTSHNLQYKIVKGGSTFWSRETDYYGTRSTITFNERFVTATRNWSFSDGNAWNATWSNNTWTFTRDNNGTTVTATKSGTLSDTTVTFTDNGSSVTATCTWSFSGTDYDSSKTYTMAVENYYWRMKATDGSTTWSGTVYSPSFSDTVQVVSLVTTVTQDAKAVTLDLYGYKITVNTSNGGIRVRNASVTLIVDSLRVGGKISVIGTGGTRNAFHLYTSIDRVATGRLVLKGDIEYDLYSSGSGYNIVSASETLGVQIDAGNFNNHGTYTCLVKVTGGPLVFNGGTFTNELDGNFYVWLIYVGSYSNNSLPTTVTINGGTFTNLNTSASSSSQEYSGYVICNNNGYAVINGGRFTFASSRNFIYSTDYRGNTWWNSRFFRIVRGEFSLSTIGCIRDSWRAHGIADYLEDGSVLNEAQPNEYGFYGAKVSGEGDYTYDAVSSFAIPYRFAIPYADADLADLCIRQSGDTLFIAHRDYPPAKIYFDAYGKAYFEELQLDNTDFSPPVVESATMVGNDPKETDNWPAEFTTPPNWLTNTQKTAVTTFKNACKSLGTVTDAGFSGNKADGSDGSCSYACSYTCTSVSVNRTTGKKTTTVSVKSFTKSITKETTTTYTDGLATGSTTRTINTDGSAENSASATSVIVTRTVRYVATYIKDGKESRPSSPFAVDYDRPWANNAVVNITIGKGANDSEPDYYNVYKDNGNGYGLIATVGVDKIAGGVSGSVDTSPLFMPDNTKATGMLVCAADFEENKGWAVGDILRKMVSSGKDSFTSSPANDICLISTAANQSHGIVFDFPASTRFDRIRVMLDGRIYDKATDSSYLIVSTNRVTCTVTYRKTDGTTGTTTKTQDAPQGFSFGGIAGGSFWGIYEDWIGLQRKAFTAPNGDVVYGHLYGKGDCKDEFNAHLRRLDFDFKTTFDGIADFASIKSIKFTFSESVYSYWTNNQQGCFHAIHFYSGGTSDSGIVQDDYINPDMTVTPPDDTQDAHFSAADEYPGCVGIYEQRLVFASTRSSPSTIWMSRIADLYNFTVHESIREDDALELTLAATEFPNINHLVMGRDLMLFGDGGEWLISPVSGNALTYKTASAKLQSMIGSDRALQPLQLADETLFAERGGTCLRSINYNYTSDSYQSNDLSVIAQSLFRANAIVSMAYKQHPDSIVECVLADGRVGTLVYMKEQEVAAWSVQELGGGWKAREIVTPKCILNGTTEMMLLVEKDGVYQMWRVRDDIDELVAAKQVVLDGLHVERTSATATDEVAVALGDGTYAVGFPVVSEFVSVRPEPEKGATAQMEIKNATESEIRVIDATTFSVKPYAIETGWREVTLPVGRNGTAVTLAEKDCKRLLTGTNNRDGRIHLRHAEPWQLTILSISNTYQVEYETEQATGDGQ